MAAAATSTTQIAERTPPKTCTRCGESKAVSAFGRDASRADGMSYVCRDCKNARARESYQPTPRQPIEQRFLAFVLKTDTCWIWTGSRDAAGYGRFSVSAARRAQSAPRIAYELFIGSIPPGLTIDHLCRNRACVNPAHLEAVTQGENVTRSPLSSSGANSRKTHCPLGHAYDKTTKNGWRRCSICDAAHSRSRVRRTVR